MERTMATISIHWIGRHVASVKVGDSREACLTYHRQVDSKARKGRRTSERHGLEINDKSRGTHHNSWINGFKGKGKQGQELLKSTNEQFVRNERRRSQVMEKRFQRQALGNLKARERQGQEFNS
jgi:hypothetical protein